MSVLKTYGSSAGPFPSKTYRLRDGRLTGYIDGAEAVQQSAGLLLTTGRFRHLIYSNDYGSELYTLIGKPRELAEIEAERMVREALAEDDRITGIKDFSVRFERESLELSFVMDTEFGDISVERSVIYG